MTMEQGPRAQDLSRSSMTSDRANKEIDKIKTYLRIRPMPKNKSNLISVQGCTVIVESNGPGGNDCIESGGRQFPFTQVFGPSSTQSSISEDCIHPLLDNFLNGENCLVFSCGTTKSGKTYTIQGADNGNFGAIQRTLRALFNSLKDSLYRNGDIKPKETDSSCFVLDEQTTKNCNDITQKILKESRAINFHQSQLALFRSTGPSDRLPVFGHISNSILYCVWISFFEINDELIFDLLVKTGSKEEPILCGNEDGKVFVKGLTECCVSTADEACHLLLMGRRNLRLATAGRNEKTRAKSRSNLFYTIKLLTLKKSEDGIFGEKAQRFTFCDFAGMERIRVKDEMKGNRHKSSVNNIKLSMDILDCIKAVRDNLTNTGNSLNAFPRVDNNLTRLFHSYLMDANRVSMIVCVNADSAMLNSTLSVLENCALANEVRKPVQISSDERIPGMESMVCQNLLEFSDNHSVLTDSNSIGEDETSTPLTSDYDVAASESDYYSAVDSLDSVPRPSSNAGTAAVLNEPAELPFPGVPSKTGRTKDAETQSSGDTEITELIAKIRTLEEKDRIREALIVELQGKIRNQNQEASHSQQYPVYLTSHDLLDGFLTHGNQLDTTTTILGLSAQSLRSEARNHNQSEKWSEERQKYEAEIAALKKELHETRQLNNKPEESEPKIPTLDANSLVLQQNVRLREEEDFLHSMISDLRGQIKDLKSELEEKRRNSRGLSGKRVKGNSISPTRKKIKTANDGTPGGRRPLQPNVKRVEEEEMDFEVMSLDDEDAEEEVVPFVFPKSRRSSNISVSRQEDSTFSPSPVSTPRVNTTPVNDTSFKDDPVMFLRF